MLFASIEFSYAYDELNFFDTEEKREALETAGRILGDRLIDDLSAITPDPSGGNTWAFGKIDADNIVKTKIRRLNGYLQTGEIVVFVWSQEDLGRLARGGPGSVTSVSGSPDFRDAVFTRGQGDDDFATWGGSITFDHFEKWSFDGSPADDEFDFMTTALHELGHVLGFGLVSEWTSFVVDGEFTGPNAVAEFDKSGNPPVDGNHWKDKVEDGGQEASMTVSATSGPDGVKGFSELDFAALEDIGWELVHEQIDGGATVAGRVTDQSGTGIPGVVVTADECLAGPCVDLPGFSLTTPIIGITDSAGFFSGTVPAAGRWIFGARGQGLTIQKEQVILSPALVQVLDFSTGSSFSLVETPRFLDTDNGRLQVYGAPANTDDEIVISRDGDDVVIEVGGIADRVPVASFDVISVDSGSGNDRLTIDFSGGDPIPSGGLRFDGNLNSTAGDGLRIVGGSFSNATYNASASGEGYILLDDAIIAFTDLESDLIELGSNIQDLVINLANEDPHALALETVSGQNQSHLSVDGGLQDIRFGMPHTLVVGGGNGTDELLVKINGQSPIPASGLTFNGKDGTDSLEVIGAVPGISHIPDSSKDPDRGTLVIGESEVSFTGLEVVRPVAPEVIDVSLNRSVIDENESVSISVEFLDPGTLSTHTSIVDWGDGSSDTLSSLPDGARSFQVSHQYLDDHPNGTQVDITAITVQVIDNDALSDSSRTAVMVRNAPPNIIDVDVDATFSEKAEEEEPVTVSATFLDVGTLDLHSALIDWGDGMVSSGEVTETGGSGTISATHAYDFGGIYSVTVTLIDDDTGTATTTTTAVVIGVGINGGVLQVVGTSGNDTVRIKRQGNRIVRVHADFLNTGRNRRFDAADIDTIVAYLCEGNDHMTIAADVDNPAIIHGGADADHLHAGGGPTVLLGDDGDDKLFGGRGRNILIGGSGSDKLTGRKDSDVLIGGSTTSDNDDDALMAIAMAWATDDYNENLVLAVDALLTVIDDGEVDRLIGGLGVDLFYDGLGDKLIGVKRIEVVF